MIPNTLNSGSLTEKQENDKSLEEEDMSEATNQQGVRYWEKGPLTISTLPSGGMKCSLLIDISYHAYTVQEAMELAIDNLQQNIDDIRKENKNEG
jgi:hypothetical protein